MRRRVLCDLTPRAGLLVAVCLLASGCVGDVTSRQSQRPGNVFDSALVLGSFGDAAPKAQELLLDQYPLGSSKKKLISALEQMEGVCQDGPAGSGETVCKNQSWYETGAWGAFIIGPSWESWDGKHWLEFTVDVDSTDDKIRSLTVTRRYLSADEEASR